MVHSQRLFRNESGGINHYRASEEERMDLVLSSEAQAGSSAVDTPPASEYFVFAVDDVPEGGHPVDVDYVLNHPSLNEFGIDFFQFERVARDRIVSNVEMLRKGMEEGSLSDEMLEEIFKFSDFAVVKFLLNAILHNLGTVDVLVRCLAFAGNIYEVLWVEFANRSAHLLLLIHSTEYLLKSVYELSIFREKPIHRRSYHGFDKRDIKDYNMEGFEDEERELEERSQAKADREERMMTMLLAATHFYQQPLDLLSVFIENQRDRGQGTESIEITSSLDPDVISERIICERLPVIAELIFDVTHSIFEDGLHQAIRLLVALSQQYPPLRPIIPSDASEEEQVRQNMGSYTELSVLFVRTDRERADGGHLQQTLLYVLNENSYPNLAYMEAMALLRFVINILYTRLSSVAGAADADNKTPFEASGADAGNEDEQGNPGNFYVNDLKVLIEVCLRELTNVVRHSGERKWDTLRLRYLHVIQAVLHQTNWSQAVDGHSKEDVKRMLEDIATEEIYAEETRIMAEYTLQEVHSSL